MLLSEENMQSRIEHFDWSVTPLGEKQNWPQSLKTTIRTMLHSRYAMWMAWGKELTFFCNDAYLPTLGVKQEWALGKPAYQVWEEIWSDIGPRIESVLNTGKATWDEGLLLYLERSGFTEETYHTFSYSPLMDDEEHIAGMLCVVTEETARLIGERRLALLSKLASSLNILNTRQEICRAVEQVMRQDERDFPFTLFYLFDESKQQARLEAHSGFGQLSLLDELHICSRQHPIWPIEQLSLHVSPLLIQNLEDYLPKTLSCSFHLLAKQAVMIPLAYQGQQEMTGFIVAGLNPFLRYDEEYLNFAKLVAGQIEAAIASADAYEQAKRQAEALAEIDRAKTAFFSNISHEFRTPLTLMLGPLEEMLAMPDQNESGLERVQVAHRNALRLLKLVNALLDFARIEANRMQASYRKVDLPALTANLASNFRSAIEKAGLVFHIDCQPVAEEMYVDRDMWEKIIFNLLSNALKYTLKGQISLSLHQQDNYVVLMVEDTGIGIPQKELPHLFKRFHRVEGVEGRTHEGTGIGLALVYDLVRLHQGEVRVESTSGKGSSFIVSIPTGRQHLPAEHIYDEKEDLDAETTDMEAFLHESLRWLPEENNHPVPANLSADITSGQRSGRPRIILADDNADMRDYIYRLLHMDYSVEAVSNGEEAFAAIIREKPDLVLSDVMMPYLDGFGLLSRLREQETTRDIPVIILSARAGGEARIEGMQAGADDYILKPFHARELLARVNAALKLSAIRKQAESRFRHMVNTVPSIIWMTDPQGNCTFLSHKWYTFTGQKKQETPSLVWQKAIHPEDREKVRQIFLEACDQHVGFSIDYRIRMENGEYAWMMDSARPFFTEDGSEFQGFVGILFDISARKIAEMEREHLMVEIAKNEERYRLLTEATATIVWNTPQSGEFEKPQPEWSRFTGQNFGELKSWGWLNAVHPDDQDMTAEAWSRALARKSMYQVEHRLKHHELGYRYMSVKAIPIFDINGDIREWIGIHIDIDERKKSESRDQFLVALDDAVRPLSEPADITRQAAYLLGTYMQVNRCAYADVDEDENSFNLTGDYNSGVHSIVGRYSFAEFGTDCLELMRGNKPYVVEDSENDQRCADVIEAYRRTSIRSVICVPLHKAGKFVSAMAVHSAQPRAWRKDEIALVSSVAARCWESIERARVARNLRESEERLHLALLGSNDGIWDWNLLTNQVYLSPRLKEMLGYQDHEMPSEVHEWSNRLHPEDKQKTLDMVEDYLRGDIPTYHITFRLRHKEGSWRWILSRGVALRDKDGKAYRMSGSHTDITELREAQEAMLEAKNRAEAASMAKSEFLANMSHEIRTPMNAVIGLSNILAKSEPLTQKQREFIKTLQLSADCLLSLINDLLDISKIEAKSIELESISFDLNQLLAEVVDMMSVKAKEKNLIFDFRHDAPLQPLYQGDPTRIRQIVMNLCSNAIKFTHHGQIILSLNSQPEISGFSDKVCLSVTDTGIGIAPDKLETIFHKFVQADSSINREFGGTGLGLAITKTLVEIMGGTIQVESEPGKGSIFTICVSLPYAKALLMESPMSNESAIAVPKEEKSYSSLNRPCILLVEDYAPNVLVASIFLEQFGYDCQVAQNGKEAIDKILTGKYALALMDVQMHEMNGLEATKFIRKHERIHGLPKFPIIGMTAHALTGDRERCLEAGMDDYVSKPFEPEDLKEKISMLLAERSVSSL